MSAEHLAQVVAEATTAASKGDLTAFYSLIVQLTTYPSSVRHDLITGVLTKLNSGLDKVATVPLDHIQTLIKQALANGDLVSTELVALALKCRDVVTSQALLLVAAEYDRVKSKSVASVASVETKAYPQLRLGSQPQSQQQLYQAIVSEDYPAVVQAIQQGADLRADRDRAFYLAAQTIAEDSIKIILILLYYGFGLNPVGLDQVLSQDRNKTQSSQPDRSPARALGVFLKCLATPTDYLPDNWSRAKTIRTLVLKYQVSVNVADNMALRFILRHRPKGKIDTAALLMLLQLGAYPSDPAQAQEIWAELALTTQEAWQKSGSCLNNHFAMLLLQQAVTNLSLA